MDPVDTVGRDVPAAEGLVGGTRGESPREGRSNAGRSCGPEGGGTRRRRRRRSWRRTERQERRETEADEETTMIALEEEIRDRGTGDGQLELAVTMMARARRLQWCSSGSSGSGMAV